MELIITLKEEITIGIFKYIKNKIAYTETAFPCFITLPFYLIFLVSLIDL